MLAARMMRSTGGEQLRAFEGLVNTTARMFAAQVRREEDDLAQELRVRVWRAVVSYDRSRSRLTLERYVFQAVTNKIKDYKRDAAREARRREDYGLTFLHIEDMRLGPQPDDRPQQESFDALFHHVSREEVYGLIEDRFVLPAGVTEQEVSVLLLLMMDLSKTEIVVKLGVAREEVERCVGALQEKFADWKPTERGNGSPVLVGERAAA